MTKRTHPTRTRASARQDADSAVGAPFDLGLAGQDGVPAAGETSTILDVPAATAEPARPPARSEPIRAVGEVAPSPSTRPSRPARAKAVLLGLTAAAVLTAGGLYAYGLGRESTDDAQVEGRVMTVSARVAGQVARVLIKDNELVEEGQVVVELDDADYRARAEAAQADLAAVKAQEQSAEAQLAITEQSADANLKQAEGGLTQAVHAVSSTRSTIEQATAEVAAAESRLHLADLELTRAKALHEDEAAPAAQLDDVQTARDAAAATLEQARARLESAKANTDGSNGGVLLARGRLVAAKAGPDQVSAARAALELAKARVQQSEAARKLAELNLSYTRIKAPRRGLVSRRNVEVGQLVGPERPLLAVVPTDDVWIVANFKEDQIGSMRAGQQARVSVDTFGRTPFAAHVESIAGASGARFALLPPDNATGNYIKVVQRIPVLIRLDEPTKVALRPGMSAYATVVTK